MKILFIFAPVHPTCSNMGMRCMPPLAIYYLGAILRGSGHDVKIVDPNYFIESTYFRDKKEADEVIDGLHPNSYDVVCMSSNTGNWGVTKEIISQIKKINTDIPIILGGLHPTYFADYILQSTEVDYIVRNEGEINLVKLIEVLRDPRQINQISSISYRDGFGNVINTPDDTQISCEELMAYPSPIYEEIPANVYDILPVETSRGCWYNCIFCSVVHKKKWRGYTVENVIERISAAGKFAKSKLRSDVGVMYLVDDCFSAEPERAIQILNEIKKKNLGCYFILECRVSDLLKPNFIEQIQKDLIYEIQIGVEAGYDEGLAKVRKGITCEQLEECMRLLLKHNLINKCFLSFILGFPWETEAEIYKTVHMAAYLSSEYGISISMNWLWLCPSDLWKVRNTYNIDVNECIFDNPLWIQDKNVFYRTHPNLNADTVNKVENVISAYKKSGLNINHADVSFLTVV